MQILEHYGCEYQVIEQFVNYGNYDPNLEDLSTRKSLNMLPDIKLQQKDKSDLSVPTRDYIEIASSMAQKREKALQAAKDAYDELMKTSVDYITTKICQEVKGHKTITEEEVLKIVEEDWEEEYLDVSSKHKNASFPEYDEAYVRSVYDECVKDIMVKVNKKGNLVLTNEGTKFIKK